MLRRCPDQFSRNHEIWPVNTKRTTVGSRLGRILPMQNFVSLDRNLVNFAFSDRSPSSEGIRHSYLEVLRDWYYFFEKCWKKIGGGGGYSIWSIAPATIVHNCPNSDRENRKIEIFDVKNQNYQNSIHRFLKHPMLGVVTNFYQNPSSDRWKKRQTRSKIPKSRFT